MFFFDLILRALNLSEMTITGLNLSLCFVAVVQAKLETGSTGVTFHLFDNDIIGDVY